MKIGLIGIIGNLSELEAVRIEPTHSYHLTNVSEGEEIAIRYSDREIKSVYEDHWTKKFAGKSTEEAPREVFAIEKKPIFRQYV